MPICSAGVSQPKAGVASSVLVDATYVKSILPAGLAWLYDYLPWMHALEIGDVGAFCALDPPTWTVPSGTDIFLFLQGGYTSAAITVEKFLEDITRAYLWYELCECASVTTPAPPSAPSAPSDLPAVNPPAIVQLPATVPCATGSFGPVTRAGANAGSHVALSPVGLDVTAVRLTVDETILSGGGFSCNCAMNWYDSSALLKSTPFSLPPATSVRSFLFPGPPNGALSGAAVFTGTGGGSSSFTSTLDYYCGGDIPGGTQSPCCPPDQTVVARLNQLLQLVTLIQRQAVPFAYIQGADHSGLSGSGELAVQGLVGLQVDTATVPARAGFDGGTPDLLFDLGRVSIGTADGWLETRRINADPFVWLPSRMSAITRIGYTIPGDMSVTITELVREP